MGQTYDTDIISWYGKNIIQDTNNRLVTDVQIDYWNKKSNPDHTHDERYYTETEINNLLNNKSNTDHTHDERYYTETEIDNKLKNISSSIPTTMTWESITGKPSSYPPSSHNHDTVYSKLGHKHTTSDITDLKGILDNKANESHTHIIANITNLQTILDGKALKIHTHEISDVTNLQASLNSKSNTDHNHDTVYSRLEHIHDNRYYTETEIDNLLKGLSGDIGAITWNTLVGKPSTFPPSSHTHTTASITGLKTALASKSNTDHNHDTVYSKLGHTHDDRYYTESEMDSKIKTINDNIAYINWQTLTGKPSTFPPSSHTHDERYYTESEMDAKLNGKSNTGHTHDDRYYKESEIDNLLKTKSDTGHIHDERYYTESEIDIKLKNISDNISNVTWTTLVGKPSTFPPSSHIHDDRYYTETEMDSKIKTINDSITNVTWQTLSGKPSTFPPSSHTHSIANITNLQATLNKKSDSSHNHDSVYSKLTHTHDDRYYTETEIDAKLRDLSSSVTSISWDNLTGKPSTFPPSSHTHSYLPLSGGTITGQIKGSFGGSWNAAREQALVYNYNSTSTTYNPIIAGKSGSGVWSIGTYPYAGEDLFFAYNLDSDYNAGNNGSQIIKLPPRTGTIALTSDIPTWDSIKPYTAFFGGISLDTNGAYIYGESNSGNIFFRYKSSPGATDYSWGNIKDIASAAYGNHRHNQSTLDFTAETHFTLNGTYTDPLYGTGTAIKATGGIATDTSYATSFRTNYVDSTSLGGQCDLENILFTGGTQWGIGKTQNALMFGQYAGKDSSGVVKFRIQDRYCYIDNGLISMGIVNTTTTNGANMRCAPNNGIVSIHSSASKYKLNIQNIAKPESYSYSILKVNPKQWYDKAETERYAKYLTAQYTNNNAIDDELKDIYSKSQVEPCYGLIAEDLEKAGLSEFCEYKEDKEGNKTVEGIQYERVPILLIPIIRDIISCMNKILPYVKEGKKIEDPNTLKQVEDLEKKFNYFKDEDVVNIQYDPQTSKIIE